MSPTHAARRFSSLRPCRSPCCRKIRATTKTCDTHRPHQGVIAAHLPGLPTYERPPPPLCALTAHLCRPCPCACDPGGLYGSLRYGRVFGYTIRAPGLQLVCVGLHGAGLRQDRCTPTAARPRPRTDSPGQRLPRPGLVRVLDENQVRRRAGASEVEQRLPGARRRGLHHRWLCPALMQRHVPWGGGGVEERGGGGRRIAGGWLARRRR